MSAVYLKRFKRDVLLLNGGKPRALWIPKTRNLLGFPEGISGQDLINRLNRHVTKLGIERCHGDAVVRRHHSGFRVRAGATAFTARKVILATGICDVQPKLANLNRLRAQGLLRYCPVCDAYDYRNEIIGVIAEKDSGIEKALWIRRFTNKLLVFIPDELKLSARRKRELHAAKVRVYRGTVSAIEPTRLPSGVWVHRAHGAPVFCRIVYPMLGTHVRDSAFSGMKDLKRSTEGYIFTTTEQRTSIPGLFAVGDCVNLLAQISVAAGQAAVAATTIHNDLLEQDD